MAVQFMYSLGIGYRFIFVLALVYFIVMVFFLPSLVLIFSLLVKRLARKSVSDMSYLVLSGMLNLNSIRLLGIW